MRCQDSDEWNGQKWNLTLRKGSNMFPVEILNLYSKPYPRQSTTCKAFFQVVSLSLQPILNGYLAYLLISRKINGVWKLSTRRASGWMGKLVIPGDIIAPILIPVSTETTRYRLSWTSPVGQWNLDDDGEAVRRYSYIHALRSLYLSNALWRPNTGKVLPLYALQWWDIHQWMKQESLKTRAVVV